MSIDLSDKTLDALAQVISGGAAGAIQTVGLYKRGWELKAWFKRFGVDYEEGSRVASTREALSLAHFIDGELMTRVLEAAIDPRDYVGHEAAYDEALEYVNKHLYFDGYRLERAGRSTRLLELVETAKVTSELSAMAEGINFDTVNRDLDRALRSVDTDPEIGVTAACAVVESVCRSILVELKIDLPSKQDISGLYRAVRDPLGLDPMKEGLAPEIVADVRGVLSGLATSIQSIGALRTHVGGAHGKEKGFRRIDKRIAKLAIHSASAASLFLIETWQVRFPGRRLPLAEKSENERRRWLGAP